MTPTRMSVAAIVCLAAALHGQAPQQPPRFRVAVDVVTIDATVTDRDGNVVRDLTAEDFEVLQDGKRQKVTYAQFVPVVAPEPVPAGASSRTTARADTPPAPATPVTRERAQRTIVVVVDDLGLSFEGMNDVKRALHTFVDTSLLPTDLTAIMRTGQARSLAQPLTTDRESLHSAIDALRYNVASRKGVSGQPDVIQTGGTAPRFNDVGQPRALPSTMGALAALTLVVQSAHDLPGRRAVIFATEGFPLGPPEPAAPTDSNRVFSSTNVRQAVDHVIDQATRAGVVIYALDAQGLQSGRLRAADDIHSDLWRPDPRVETDPDAAQRMVRDMASQRQLGLVSEQDSLLYLSDQTGGFGVLNTNDLARGFGRISSDVRDYYVIGYQPDADTFRKTRARVPMHHIEVKVRRDGVRVRSRKEFVGVTDTERSSAPTTPAQELVQAAMSPFSTTAIAVSASNHAAYAPGQGSFVRVDLHLDARALSFSADPDGSRRATVDLVAVLFNSYGVQVDNIATGFDVTLKDDHAAEQVMKNGLVYTTRVPIKAPGGYQLRYAVRDRRSGAIGSGGGFVEIPDVAGGAFALSGLRAREAFPVYAPGAAVSYGYEVYNAGKSVQIAETLWRGTEKVASVPASTLVPPVPGRPFSATGTVTLAGDLPAGSYMLQIVATSDDPKDPKKTRATEQWLTLEVGARSSAARRLLY